MTSKRIFFLLFPNLLLSLIAFALQSHCHAQTIATSGDVDPIYNGTDNPWDAGRILKVGDLTQGALSVDGAAEVLDEFGYIGFDVGSEGEVSLSNGASWNNTRHLYLGFSGKGMLSIDSNASVSSEDAYLGYLSHGFGSVSISGGQWNNSGLLFVGRVGSGQMFVDSAGVVTSSVGVIGAYGGSGSATISGTGSRWDNAGEIFVGLEAEGSLAINGGGALSSSGAQVGQSEFGSGSLTVEGNNSTWNNSGTLTLGYLGNARLNVLNGGNVSTQSVNMGDRGGHSEALVSGDGARLSIDGTLLVGRLGTANLRIDSGGQVTNDYSQIALGSVASATVSGAGSLWQNNNTLDVGALAEGSLDVVFGGRVVAGEDVILGRFEIDNHRGNGVINIDGIGSTLISGGDLVVGGNGGGIMNVSQGGTLETDPDSSGVTYNSYLGRYTGSSGEVSVTGIGSSWTNQGEIHVGQGGIGELNIESGGLVDTSSISIGSTTEGGTGRVTVSGAGSILTTKTVLTNIFVGNNSSLLIQNGATAVGSGAIFGDGTATVAGVGSLWDTGTQLNIGTRSQGTLNILSGASLESEDVRIAAQTSGRGDVVVSENSNWNVQGDMLLGFYFGNQGIANLTITDDAVVKVGGLLQIGQDSRISLLGGLLDVGVLEIETGASLTFETGTLHADRIVGDFAQDGGVFSPGHSPGLTEIEGNYELIAGCLLLEIAGYERGVGFDAIDIFGNVTLAGTIDVDFLDGFTALEGDSFQFINAANYKGTPEFDFSDAALATGLVWNTSQFMNNGTLSVNAVPEPSSVIVVFCLASIFGIRRERILNQK